jgi:hypothetical protein
VSEKGGEKTMILIIFYLFSINREYCSLSKFFFTRVMRQLGKHLEHFDQIGSLK